LFSAVISEHLIKNRMIISVVAAKIRYLKNVRFYWATLYIVRHISPVKMLRFVTIRNL